MPEVAFALTLRKSRRLTSDCLDIAPTFYLGILAFCVSAVSFCYSCLPVVPVMNKDAMTKHEHTASGNSIAPVLVPVVSELSHSERIRGQQAVVAGVPIGWMAKVLRVIKDSDANVFAAHSPRVIHPISLLTPNRFLFGAAIRAHHMDRWRLEGLHEADGECPFFGVTHLHRTVARADRKLAVDGPRIRIASEGESLSLLGNRLAVGR